MQNQHNTAQNPSINSPITTGYQVVCYFSKPPQQADNVYSLVSGHSLDLGVFATYSEALAARLPYTKQPDYVGCFIGEPSLYTQAEHAHKTAYQYQAICFFTAPSTEPPPLPINAIRLYLGVFATRTEAFNACCAYDTHEAYMGYHIQATNQNRYNLAEVRHA